MSEPIHQEIARLDALARALDAQFKIPFTRFRVGWDGILGLVPVLGDAVAFAPAAYLIWRARALGVSSATIARMGVNTGIDVVIGSIPLVGSIFDIGFKANLRNIALLREDLHEKLKAAAPAETKPGGRRRAIKV